MQSSKSDSRFCRYCGFENPQDFKLCGNCNLETPMKIPAVIESPLVVGKPKSQMLYIFLGITAGFIGVHNFYAGRRAEGLFQLILFLVLFWTIIIPLGLMVWSVIEVCTVRNDGSGRPMS